MGPIQRKTAALMKTSPSIGEYLIQRLHANGVRHVFGIPGDYVLGFYDLLPGAGFVSSTPATNREPASLPTPTLA